MTHRVKQLALVGVLSTFLVATAPIAAFADTVTPPSVPDLASISVSLGSSDGTNFSDGAQHILATGKEHRIVVTISNFGKERLSGVHVSSFGGGAEGIQLSGGACKIFDTPGIIEGQRLTLEPTASDTSCSFTLKANAAQTIDFKVGVEGTGAETNKVVTATATAKLRFDAVADNGQPPVPPVNPSDPGTQNPNPADPKPQDPQTEKPQEPQTPGATNPTQPGDGAQKTSPATTPQVTATATQAPQGAGKLAKTGVNVPFAAMILVGGVGAAALLGRRLTK
ncbi:hypothetical protein [Schaalia suimastitidis]|uniref:hypothetical protein n=1 Tax=Schaalia suimastitidis TaxID=121163 RepID=UPI0004136361|nr:hypothetical protein [Schaalia suimastitidis]